MVRVMVMVRFMVIFMDMGKVMAMDKFMVKFMALERVAMTVIVYTGASRPWSDSWSWSGSRTGSWSWTGAFSCSRSWRG